LCLGCGFDATATSVHQTLSSPNYPNNYDNDEYCEWNIAADPGQTIQIDFIDFHTEANYDYLVRINFFKH